MTISELDRRREISLKGLIGSTGQGVGQATARRIVGRGKIHVKLARDVPALRPYLRESCDVLQRLFREGKRAFLEGTQGTGLSIFHGHYPHVTSRDTTVTGCLAEAGISPTRVVRLLRTCKNRIQRHLEDVKSAVDYDYRAGSDYEIKLMKLEWHLDRAKNYGNAVTELNNLLRHSTFFQVHQEIEIVSLRRQVIHRCGQIGEALIDVYQRIEDYLNRVHRHYARARKLIQVCGLIERHEHLTGTNLSEIAATANGPWFHEFRFRTLLAPTVIDGRPELLQRALTRAGIGAAAGKPRRVEIDQETPDDVPPVIDWQNVYEAFAGQRDDLFVFLNKVQVEGRALTEEERIDGYCAIITNEDWAGAWDGRPFELASDGDWEYAVVRPPAALST